MSNTVITNYTDLNGPSTKADSSVVVIVNKDGSLSVDQNLLGTLMGTDGTQAAGISVVRVGHEGKPDDATDSESEDEKIPHVTLSVDSYYNEPSSIIKYDSGAEMLQSLRIETRENSLIGFQNDHCYTPLTSPNRGVPQRSDSLSGYDDSVIEITHSPPPKPVPQSKKIVILEQQILPKGKKIAINPTESSVILKGNDVLSKPLPLTKAKQESNLEKSLESAESSSLSSEESIPDRDSDSDYKDTHDRSVPQKLRKQKTKPRILKSTPPVKGSKVDSKLARLKTNKSLVKRDIKDKCYRGTVPERKPPEDDQKSKENISVMNKPTSAFPETSKVVLKPTQKPVKKEKKTPAHVSALLSDMSSLFSTPDVIRRVSTDGKTIDSKSVTPKSETTQTNQKPNPGPNISKLQEVTEKSKSDIGERMKNVTTSKLNLKDRAISVEKVSKGFDLIPQLDDASLAQILQDTNSLATNPAKVPPSISTGTIMNSPGLAGPLSPTLDLLGALQPEEEGLSEDLLMHVAQLVESSENLQEVIDKQVLGKVDTVPVKSPAPPVFHQNPPVSTSSYMQTPTKSLKQSGPRKEPIEIVCRDGRVITLPPIEAPTTRSSKRKSQTETSNNTETVAPPPAAITTPMSTTPEPQVQNVSRQYSNKKLAKKIEQPVLTAAPVPDDKLPESQDSWNSSEDDPYRLWCICKQPHNNRFMICCDSCEDWFHGKCVNITKAMGQQMEEQGIEWRCPNCTKKTTKITQKVIIPKMTMRQPPQNKNEPFDMELSIPQNILSKEEKDKKDIGSKTHCIVCKKLARASSIYCSDACILKHAQDSLGSQGPSKSDEFGRTQDRIKADARVTVYERKTGKLFAGLNAPTAENLKTWLQQNPTFEVVRPGILKKPNAPKKRPLNEPHLVQTTLNYDRIPRKSNEHSLLKTNSEPQKITHNEPQKIIHNEPRMTKLLQSPKPITPSRDVKTTQPKTPVTRSNPPQWPDTPRPSTSTAKISNEPKKVAKQSTTKSLDKASAVSPSTSRRKEAPDTKKKMDSEDSVRENVRKSLQEQMSLRMAENSKENKKFTEAEIKQFAIDTEAELHELFRDAGMKYKAKYRSLMFNIKDRKNMSLWKKICDGTITPKQLVRLSPEDLASQELAEWRDQEAKHQLELIKKSELDLLAASKTYVLKTHKGEEVMQNKESVSTELDPNVPVEDVVVALNEAEVGEEVVNEILQDGNTSKNETNVDNKHISSKKRDRDRSSSRHSKKKKRDSDRRESRSSRRKSDQRDKEERSSRHFDKKRSSRARSVSKERSKKDISKEKSDLSEHSRRRSRSRGKSRRKSKSRDHSRSQSKTRDRDRSRSKTRDRDRSRSKTRDRDRSRSREHTRRSPSRGEIKRRRSSRSKHVSSTDDKPMQRSKSQENIYKSKNDSTDSESIERPKSALMKEVHPEYDPHEPMITSAFSEEDLRKAGGDSFDESYKPVGDFMETEYIPSKPFTIDTSIVLPSEKFIPEPEKVSEPESDQEPTSTVENTPFPVWSGCINMVDVARFYVAAYEVSGNASDLEEDLSAELDIVGRINPDTVWDYISKMKRAGNKDILVLKLQAANDEEKMQYIALYSYLSSRNRLGVVKVCNSTTLKDFYIVPLAAQSALPPVLQPLGGAGLGGARTHLLVAIIVRQRDRRKPRPPLALAHTDIVPAKVGCESLKRSYTPPLVSKTLPLPAYTSPALSSSVKDKIAASLAAADEDEAYSPGSSSSGGSAAPPSAALRDKMEEINRQIEEQKKQILKMAQADSSVADDEAYSPSRPMTPPAPVVPLADIALPSNLHEILATIKQRSEAHDRDIRNLPLPPT